MRVSTQRFAVALLIAGVFATKAHADTSFYDAMALAIEHTNAAHERDVKAWGPEHELMYNALRAVEREIPAVEGINRLGYLSHAGSNDPFRTLSREFYLGGDESAERLLAERLEARVNELVLGCPFERTTTIEETDLGYTQPSVQTSVVTHYRLEGTSKKKCANALTQSLVKAGINRVTLAKHDRAYSSGMEITFAQESNLYRDMEYVKRNLLKIEALRDLVSELETGDLTGTQVIGKSSNISLVGSTGAASLGDAFRLEYWKGWGDCPAGCISGHTWLVEVTPLAGGEFKVVLLEESGSPLPGDGEVF